MCWFIRKGDDAANIAALEKEVQLLTDQYRRDQFKYARLEERAESWRKKIDELDDTNNKLQDKINEIKTEHTRYMESLADKAFDTSGVLGELRALHDNAQPGNAVPSSAHVRGVTKRAMDIIYKLAHNLHDNA